MLPEVEGFDRNCDELVPGIEYSTPLPMGVNRLDEDEESNGLSESQLYDLNMSSISNAQDA